MKHKRMFSLRYKQLLILLVGAALSWGMYSLTQTVGNLIINKNYLNETAVSQRITACQDSFQKYIDENHIPVSNVNSISKWVTSQKDVYLIIYKEDKVIYQAGCWNEKIVDYELSGSTDDSLSLSTDKMDDSTYPYFCDIKFSDGIYTVSIIEFSEIKWYNIVTYLSWGIFFFIIFAILIIYNHRTISRIRHFSKEVSLIENGKLEQEISHKGNDEISLLALNVDNMRNSIIARLQGEKEAWEANSELITSMSHDIRTPLTSLIGYLEILDLKDYHSEEQLEKYIKRCREKSIQLKDLSDKLFQYFLVFGKEKITMQMETFDVNILFQQLLCEHIFDLSNLGFNVKTSLAEQSCKITADIHYLKRLFDNLFYNVEKYARLDGQVIVIGNIKGNDLFISISNDIRKDSELVESTNIGLKTCHKIVEQMNGAFEINKNDQHRFEVRIIFPLQLKGEE